MFLKKVGLPDVGAIGAQVLQQHEPTMLRRQFLLGPNRRSNKFLGRLAEKLLNCGDTLYLRAEIPENEKAS